MNRVWNMAWRATVLALAGVGALACGGTTPGDAEDPASDARTMAAPALVAPSPAETAVNVATPPRWTRIAVEGTTATVGVGQTVRYGYDSAWVVRTVSGAVPCTKAFFGADPAPGIVKQCDLLGDAATDEVQWQRFAWEYQPFNLAAPTLVRYGTGTHWVEATLPAGTASCSNVLFGSDPAPGLAKQCQVRQVPALGR